MSKFLGNYSNGWGHMILTVVIIGCMSTLLALGKIEVAVFSGIVSPVVLFWFGTGIANKAIESVAKLTPDISSPTERPLVEPQPIILQEPPKQSGG